MPFHVLTLSGGGFLGYYTVCVLAALEQHAGRPVSRCFDLIAGTSVGGIIAACLAAGVAARDIKRAFEQHGQHTFSNRRAPQNALTATLELMRSLLRSKYNGSVLRQALDDLVGKDTRLVDLKHRLLVPVVNLTDGVAHVFKTPHHAGNAADAHVRVTDVAMATSAAPTYFAAVDIDGKRYTDGSLYLNAPDQLAVHEAIHVLGVDAAHIRMLSVGTSTAHFYFPHDVRPNLGGYHWVYKDRLLKVTIGSQQSHVVALMEQELGPRYLRIDAVKSPAQDKVLSLDVATNEAMQMLATMAADSLEKVRDTALLQELCGMKQQGPSL